MLWKQQHNSVQASVASYRDFTVWAFAGSVQGREVVLQWMPWGQFGSTCDGEELVVKEWTIAGSLDGAETVEGISTQTWQGIKHPSRIVTVRHRIQLHRATPPFAP